MQIEWTGDLEDDCTCRVKMPDGGLLMGRAECLVNETDTAPFPGCWYIGVYENGDPIFHSADAGGHPYCSGQFARSVAEAVIKSRLK